MASKGGDASVRQNSASTRVLQRQANARPPPTSANTRTSANGTKEAKPLQRFLKGTHIRYEKDAAGLLAIMWHPMNLLLIFQPLGVAAKYLHWGDLWAFWLNFVALIPLAKILGDATEELAANLKNDMIAGLLNATFGNAVEVVITIQSLRAGMIRIVKTSLLGSVLSNTLLVLGMSFFFGGIMTTKTRSQAQYETVGDGDEPASIRSTSQSQFEVSEKIQTFSMMGALVNTSMLLVSCLCFSLVTVFRMVLLDTGNEMQDILLPVSRISSVIVIMAYVAYIFFQLVTHKEAMADPGEEEEDEGAISFGPSFALLFISTAVVAYSSNLMVDAIEGVTANSHISEHFIGIILLPIVGNACEHAAAVRFAVQDKLGLSVSIAVGSSTQIALFVVPLSVIMGWLMDVPMDLNFGVLNSSLITLSVVVILSMVVDGQSNWLQGYLLMSVYLIISVMYWHLPNEINDGTDLDHVSRS